MRFFSSHRDRDQLNSNMEQRRLEMPPRHMAIAERLIGRVDELDHPRRLVQVPMPEVQLHDSAKMLASTLVKQQGNRWFGKGKT